MAETMLQVFQRHRDCFDFTKEPNPAASTEARQMCYERQQEREQAANEYVNGILAANNNWAEDINEDVVKLALSFQGILNKAEREAYKEAADQFLHYVASTLREHRVRQLSPITRYRMGREEFPAMNIVTGLSRDEAAREYQRMKKQGFAQVCFFPTEAFPAVFTVFGYKPKDRKPREPQGNAHSDTKGAKMGNDTTPTLQTPPAGKGKPGRPRKEHLDDVIADQQRYAKIEPTLRERITDKEAVAIIPHLWALADKEIGVFGKIPSFGQLTNRFKIATTTPQGYNEQIRNFVSNPTEIGKKGTPLKKMYLALINKEKQGDSTFKK